MRLVKSIIKIKDCPSFVDFRPTNLPEFGQYNLIYGWNGSGKTTLSRLFRSFELNNNYYDNPSAPGQFEFLLDDNSSIDSTNFSAYKEVRVFNSDFVRESVFCIGGPKPLFYLGKESKESKEKIIEEEQKLELIKKDETAKQNALNQSVDSKDKALSAKAKAIKEALTTTRQDKYRNYDKTSLLNAITTHSQKLASPDSLKLTNEKLLAVQKSIQQSSKEKLTNINIPDLDLTTESSEAQEIINRSIVSEVIESLKTDEEIGAWVESGLHIHKEKRLEKCAFCDQNLPTDRIEKLDKHFNQEYQKTIDDIKTLKEKLHTKKLQISFADQSALYDDLSSEYSIEKAKAEKLVDSFNSNINILLSVLDEKQKNLFKNPQTPTLASLSADSITRVNNLLDRHNTKTDNFDKQVASEKETLELHHIANFISLHNQSLALCTRLAEELKGLQTQVKEKENEIKGLKQGLISHHIPAQKINESLEKFLGRSDIQITANDSQDGYEITRNGVLAKNLSEGEETALAIVYFLAKIEEDGFDLKNSLIVIDDPVSSLDSNAIFLAFSFIKESIKEAGQIIILTHHFDFFRQVKNWLGHIEKFNKKKCSYYMAVCKNEAGVRKSSLLKLDELLLKFESEYHFIFDVLYRFSKKNEQGLSDIYSMPNVARKFLESFLAFRVPITVGVTNIDSRLSHIDFDQVKKTRINRFVQTHSHPRYEAGVQDFDMSLLAEAPQVISDILEMVEHEDKKHYDHLIKSVDPTVSAVVAVGN